MATCPPCGKSSSFLDADGFPLVGAACGYELCRERDYLPFNCSHCAGKFCLKHVSPADHECKAWDAAAEADKIEGAKAIVCPICKKGVRYEAGPGAAEAAWHAHEAVCEGKPKDLPRCPAPGCSKPLTESGSVICGTCRKRVCLKHRYEDLHPCRTAAIAARFSGQGQATNAGLTNVPSGHEAASASAGISDAQKGRADWLSKFESVPSENAAVSKATKPSVPKRAVDAAELNRCLDRICASADTSAQEACFRTLVKVFENAARNPAEAKFRRLGRANQALATKVFSVNGAEALLRAAGWVTDGDDALVLPSGVLPEISKSAAAAVQRRLQHLQTAAPTAATASAPAAKEAAVITDWSCAVCTLVNPSTSSCCDACGTARST